MGVFAALHEAVGNAELVAAHLAMVDLAGVDGTLRLSGAEWANVCVGRFPFQCNGAGRGGRWLSGCVGGGCLAALLRLRERKRRRRQRSNLSTNLGDQTAAVFLRQEFTRASQVGANFRRCHEPPATVEVGPPGRGIGGERREYRAETSLLGAGAEAR